jgi:hypothetical protein
LAAQNLFAKKTGRKKQLTQQSVGTGTKRIKQHSYNEYFDDFNDKLQKRRGTAMSFCFLIVQQDYLFSNWQDVRGLSGYRILV